MEIALMRVVVPTVKPAAVEETDNRMADVPVFMLRTAHLEPAMRVA